MGNQPLDVCFFPRWIRAFWVVLKENFLWLRFNKTCGTSKTQNPPFAERCSPQHKQTGPQQVAWALLVSFAPAKEVYHFEKRPFSERATG